ncbi:Hypothetical predicted protein [Mytilus galloprovincialis]|uniref:SGNH hydrolase-type esterase domain-containing protein n=1 Tax=Mytilus galloprovincialis TaxID=29158 RepID=A0A8B6FGP6_MYTGA|nr:Hypothetical predicted protein [Mytilus galloprovincialis]
MSRFNSILTTEPVSDINDDLVEIFCDDQPGSSQSSRSLKPKESKRSTGTLLIGSSIIRDINKNKFILDTDPICVRGGKTNDITQRLLALPKDTELKNIIIQAGSNDCCSSNFESDKFNEDYKILVATAKSVCENVVISGMCPRLDDSQGNIVKGNERIKQIANDKNFLFIDNNFNFRLLSGAIDMSLYNRDGVHLNTKGVAKLVRNLDITPKEKPEIQDDLRRTPVYQKPRRQDNTNSGYAHSHRTQKQAGETRGRVHPHLGDSKQSRSQGYSNHSNVSNNVKLCWYCGEKNHTSSVCRHGAPVICHRCNGEAKSCQMH